MQANEQCSCSLNTKKCLQGPLGCSRVKPTLNLIFFFFYIFPFSVYFSLAKAVDHIMEIILFTMTLTCTTIIALNLFAVELNGLLSMATLTAFCDLLGMLLLLIMFCYLSECITSDLLEIGDIFYNSPWYQLRVEQQRLLALPIRRAQRVFRLKGLGLIDCSLVVFSSVRNTL